VRAYGKVAKLMDGEKSGSVLAALYRVLPAHRKREGVGTFFLMLVGALAEVASVGAVLPLLGALTNPQGLMANTFAARLISMLPLGTNLVAVTAVAFMIIIVLSGFIRLLLTWFSQSLAFNISHDLSVSAFGKIIRQDYPYYVQNHSGRAISQFEKLQFLTFALLLSGIQAVISSVIAAFLIVLLVAVNPQVALISASLLIGAYVLISFAVQPTLRRNSRIGSFYSDQRIKYVQEAIGTIRDILLDHSQPVFEAEFAESADRFRLSNVRRAFVSQSPRILIEMLGLVMIAAYAWHRAGLPGGVAAAIPMLGALALGAQRLLPLLQQTYAGWSSFTGYRESLLDVVELLSLEDCTSPPTAARTIAFRASLRFDHVGFSYPTGGEVLHDISFSIRAGERIGITGPTGSGKSTLMDLMLGLLEPQQGAILIDERPLNRGLRAAWQGQIAHVPQAIYLSDDTLTANIAFGVPSAMVDPTQVEQAARAAGISEFIAGLQDGYSTRTGERGIRLSGGQRQRIGIARALYKSANVLIFDEATSALDTHTEEAVMRSIRALDKEITIIMIAHRLTTLIDCDRIIHLERGRIERIVGRAEITSAPAR
jgi:ABC-type multidrug transport system fused ATPase/permease subunit